MKKEQTLVREYFTCANNDGKGDPDNLVRVYFNHETEYFKTVVTCRQKTVFALETPYEMDSKIIWNIVRGYQDTEQENLIVTFKTEYKNAYGTRFLKQVQMVCPEIHDKELGKMFIRNNGQDLLNLIYGEDGWTDSTAHYTYDDLPYIYDIQKTYRG